MRKLGVRWIGAAIAMFLLVACIPTQVNLTCALPTADHPAPPSLAIDLYVDGTPSMKGYVNAPSGRYQSTLEALLGILNIDPVAFDGSTRSQNRETQYFRLGVNDSTGKAAQKITRDQYRQAELPQFYGGDATFPSLAVSQIDTAVVPSDDGNKMTVIVTDLYQAKEDAEKIANSIKNYLMKTHQGGAVGVLGIRSEFNGTVYTEGQAGAQSFDYNSKGQPQRPFYLLIMGNLEDVHFYIDTLLKRLSFGKEVQVNIFSPYQMYKAPAQLNRRTQGDLTPEERLLVSAPIKRIRHRQLAVNLEDSTVQPLVLRENRKPIQLGWQATLEPISRVLTPNAEAFSSTITPKTFRKSDFETDTSNTALQEVLTLNNWKPEGDNLSFSAEIHPDKLRPGIYLFEAETTINAVGDPFPTPTWWQEWNSPPTSQDGAKTHELQMFLTDLKSKMMALMRQKSPLVGRFCYLIQRN
jgi:hypothetical protein